MILAGITLFNPDIPVLKKNIASLQGQVDKLILLDNGSSDGESLRQELELDFGDLHIIRNEQNAGIATALNQIFGYAKQEGYDWVLTVDQDSCCPSDLIEKYEKYMSFPNVGSICPVICDRHYENKDTLKGEYALVDKCITSASLTPLAVWEQVEGFMDDLFIDFVDHDFSAKLLEHGFQIIRVNSVHLEHEIGQGKTHFFIWRKVTTLNHPSFRKYYMVRNWRYYIKAHRKVINVPLENTKFVFFFVKTVLYEKNRKEKLKEMMRGLKDAKQFCEKHIRK
jgi:rhamnosyltransferase